MSILSDRNLLNGLAFLVKIPFLPFICFFKIHKAFYEDFIRGEGLIAKFIAILVVALLDAMIFILIYFSLYLFEPFISSDPVLTNGVVYSTKYSPESYVPVVVSTGKTTTTTMQYVPESWSATVNVDGDGVYCSISESQFNHFKPGTDVSLSIQIGVITGETHCQVHTE